VPVRPVPGHDPGMSVVPSVGGGCSLVTPFLVTSRKTRLGDGADARQGSVVGFPIASPARSLQFRQRPPAPRCAQMNWHNHATGPFGNCPIKRGQPDDFPVPGRPLPLAAP
jgi:hypothetical protein